MNQINILCVVSEKQTCKLLVHGLGGYGYRMVTATSAQETQALTAQIAPDLILLDIDLDTALQGFEVCQDLRESYIGPIFFLSTRQDKNTKIVAFNLGADDFITKPFDMEELEARIRAALRREAIKETKTPTAQIRIDDFALDLAKRRVFLNGDEIHFTPTEYSILSTLVVNAGQVLNADELLGKVWKGQRAKPEHYLRVYVNTIRRKLQEEIGNPRYIFTETGVGYRFADAPKRRPFSENGATPN